MAADGNGTPASPGPREPEAAAAPAAGDPATGQSGPGPAADAERYGPLALDRMTKDDGRALLVYAGVPGGADAP